jgi:hypothetical protein
MKSAWNLGWSSSRIEGNSICGVGALSFYLYSYPGSLNGFSA